jgi:hypothetical protein
LRRSARSGLRQKHSIGSLRIGVRYERPSGRRVSKRTARHGAQRRPRMAVRALLLLALPWTRELGPPLPRATVPEENKGCDEALAAFYQPTNLWVASRMKIPLGGIRPPRRARLHRLGAAAAVS